MKLSDYIADFLVRQGIHHVFVVSGGAAVHMIDSIAKHKGIDYICTAHEQGAGTAADGYARISDNLGATIVTSGPGPTNLLTSIANLYYDSVPAIFLCGQVATFRLKKSPFLRQKGFQETDVVSIFKPVTNYAVRIKDPREIRFELEKAIYLATHDRRGPVVLDIPDDIQREEVDPTKLKSFRPKTISADPLLKNKILKIVEMIKQAKRPISIFGAGVRLSKTRKEALEFAHHFHIPVLLTWGATDLMPYRDKLNMNGLGVCGPRWGNFAVQNADLVIAMGTRLSQQITGGKQNLFSPQSKKILVDVDKEELVKFTHDIFDVDLSVQADLAEFFRAYKKELKIKFPDKFKKWRKTILTWRKKYPICPTDYFQRKDLVNPYVFIKALSKLTKNGDIFYTDTGANLAWMNQAFEVKKGQRIMSAWNHTPMGYALPASIGGALASKKDVICLIGDGGLMMCLAELVTVRKHNLPIKIFIFNNHGHGIQKQTIDTWLGSRYNAVDEKTGLAFPDFIKVGKTFGIPTVNIFNHKNLDKKLKEVLQTKGPVLCNLEIIPDQKIVPMLKFGAGLEDLSPNLSSEELKGIMKTRYA